MTFARAHPGLVAINLLGTTIKILMIGTAYWYVFMAGGARIRRGWISCCS